MKDVNDNQKKKTGYREETETVPMGRPGQDLVMIGWLALDGTTEAAELERKRLLERLPEELLEDTARYCEKIIEAERTYLPRLLWEGGLHRQPLEESHRQLVLQESVLTQLHSTGVTAIYPLWQGGIMNGLWYMSQLWQTGFTIQLKEIPIRQESIEICEMLGIHPYYVKSRYCILAAMDHGHRFCDVLRAWEIPAAVIGVLTDSKDRVLLHDDTTSYLNRPQADAWEEYKEQHRL